MFFFYRVLMFMGTLLYNSHMQNPEAHKRIVFPACMNVPYSRKKKQPIVVRTGLDHKRQAETYALMILSRYVSPFAARWRRQGADEPSPPDGEGARDAEEVPPTSSADPPPSINKRTHKC